MLLIRLKCSVLSHTVHTLISRSPTLKSCPHKWTARTDGKSDVLEEETPSTVNGDFDFDEFYDLATRVLNGDSDSLVNLKSLKVRWEQKFNTRQNPALKTVAGRPSTPFRPRISFLPRRTVRTDMDTLSTSSAEQSNILVGGSGSSELVALKSGPVSDQVTQEDAMAQECGAAPSVEQSNILVGGLSGSELDSHLKCPVSQEQSQEDAIPQDCGATTQIGDMVISAVHDGLGTGINRKNPECLSNLASNSVPPAKLNSRRTSGHLCW
ncbi:UNVERIFIED_CONTAM: hypothetical protein Sradi_6957000 [Sesamum radiatum]|uniref:Uncharacterized protein n=1 Tax=Sesamum radiatum TaxID=300843 RepID=A0AAW2JFJ3_SESRA